MSTDRPLSTVLGDGHVYLTLLCGDNVFKRPIEKLTSKRVWFTEPGGDQRRRSVDRAGLETKGLTHAKPWGVWLDPPNMGPYYRPALPDMAQLKADMAAAHPDRGGTDREFIAARRRYERARQVTL